MERIKKYLLVTLLVLLMGITIDVNAENFNYYLSNSEQNYEFVNQNNNKAVNIKRGDTIKVVAIIDNKDNVTNYHINNGKLTIRWEENYLELQSVNGKYYNDSITDITGLSIGSANKTNNKLTISGISSTGVLKSGKNKIVELTFKVLENATAGDTKIKQMDGEDDLKCQTDQEETIVNCGESLYSEIKYTLAKSTITKLTSVKINGYALEDFNEDQNEYDIQVDYNVEKVNIEVTKKDSRSSINGNNGETAINYGLNKLVINVISESGDRNTYNFNVTREDLRSNDNSLKTLTVSSGELEFKPDVKEYTVNVENEIEKITITSSLNDSKAKYVEDYQNKEIVLNEGSNKVEIKIISEKGEERVYTLNINRSLSSNNSLKYIKVNDEKISLKENEFIYNIEFDNSVDEVVIKAEANDPKATIDLKEKYPLEVGENEISVVVKAASGKEATYILNITRNKLLSKDSLLTSIKIKGYDINFKQNVTTYDLKIKDNEEQLEITTTQEDPNATVEIEGNKDLIDGSIIKINVKAEDGSFTRYFIRIEKGSQGISPVIIILIVLILLLAICVGLIIYRKKKKEQDKFDKLDDNKKEAKEETTKEEVKEETSEASVPSEESKEEQVEEPIQNSEHQEVKEEPNIEEKNIRDDLLAKGAHEYTGEHEHVEKTNESAETIQENIDNSKDIE